MFNFSWSEILLIGAVALVVIGPKDLPRALRTAGIFMRRMRGFAREFQGSIDQMVREAELDEAEKQFRKSIAEVELPDFSLDHPAIAQPIEPPAELTPAPSILAPGPAIPSAVPSEPPPRLAAAASVPPAETAQAASAKEAEPAKKTAKGKKAKIEAAADEAAQPEPEKKPRKPRTPKAKPDDAPPAVTTSPPEP